MHTAVVIEDDTLTAIMISDLLKSEGLVSKIFCSTDDAWHYCENTPPELLIFDWCVPGTISPDILIRKIQEMDVGTRCICISGLDTSELRQLTGNDLAIEFMPKPVHYEQLLSDIRPS